MNQSIEKKSKPEENAQAAPGQQQVTEKEREVVSMGNVLVLLGSVILISGMFFPWVAYKGGSFLTTAFEFHGAGYVVLAAGIGMAILSLVGILKKLENIQLMTLSAILCLLVTAYFYIDIISTPKLWGSGFIVSGLGILVLLMGTCFMGLNPRARRN
jgi:hypothetical protein